MDQPDRNDGSSGNAAHERATALRLTNGTCPAPVDAVRALYRARHSLRSPCARGSREALRPSEGRRSGPWEWEAMLPLPDRQDPVYRDQHPKPRSQ